MPSSEGRQGPSAYLIIRRLVYFQTLCSGQRTYIVIFTRPCISTGIESSKSSIKIPNSKGDMTDPCGTPAGQVRVVDSTPGSLTCCILPLEKALYPLPQKPVDVLAFKLGQKNRVID